MTDDKNKDWTDRKRYKAAALSGFLNSKMAELLIKDRGDAAIHDLIALGCAKVADALIAEDEARDD